MKYFVVTEWCADPYYMEGGDYATVGIYPDRATAELANERFEKLGRELLAVEEREFTFDEPPEIERCPTCGGSGKEPTKCPRCGGSGYDDLAYRACGLCDGTKTIERECEGCRGHGYRDAQ